MTESVELIQVILGLKPYLLIELDYDGEDESGEDQFTVSMRGGSGIGSPEEIREMLELALDALSAQQWDQEG